MRIIVDTDFGDDIDDTFALAYMLKIAPNDIALINAACGQTGKRAALIARFLTRCGYDNIPLGVGVEDLSARDPYQCPFGEGYTLDSYPRVEKDGIKSAVDIIMSSTEPVTIMALGPMTNLAEMVKTEPRIVEKSRVVAMFGSVYHGYFGAETPDREYNVFADVEASKVVMSQWKDITIAPLDTCGLLAAKGDAYRALCNAKDSVVQTLMSDFRQWLTLGFVNVEADSTSILYDILPIYMIYDNALLEYETLNIAVDDEGYTRVSEDGFPVKCALRWKSDASEFINSYCRAIAGSTT